MKNLIKIYDKIILNKSSIITFCLTIVLIFALIVYMLITQKDGYELYVDLVNTNYIETLGTIICVSITFLIVFITQRESNLLIDSFDVMEEAKKGRTCVFLTKQIVYISFSILFSMIFFLLSFVPSYFIFDMLKINILTSYLSYLIFTLIILEMSICIDYLTKNFFVTLMFSLLVVILEMITLEETKYFIPTIKFDNGFVLDSGLYYGLIYFLLYLFLNFLLYRTRDRN